MPPLRTLHLAILPVMFALGLGATFFVDADAEAANKPCWAGQKETRSCLDMTTTNMDAAPVTSPAVTSTAITTTGAALPIAALTPTWSGDYETGDWSQWESVPMTGPVSKSIFTTGATQGLRAARFESGPSTSYSRVELQRDVIAYDEAMRLEWDQYVPSTTKFAAHGSFNHLVQFHPWYDPCYGSSLAVNGLTSPERLILRMRGGQVSDTTGGCVYPTDRTYDLGPLPRDQWLHFVLAIRWSADPTVGYLSLTLNGQQMIARTAQAVGFLGPNGERRAIHLRQGLYRFQSPVTTVVYGDGFRKYAP